MSKHLGAPIAEARAVGALALANARFWPTVVPAVRRGLHYWETAARQIPDPHLRALAVDKIGYERFNTEVATTLATLVPRRHRADAVEAIVALQVMYDYLDGLTEEPAPDPILNGRLLFSAFTASLALAPINSVDYYRHHRYSDDGGYLNALVTGCRRAFQRLPRAAAVAQVARAAALRCGESQTRTHAIEALGTPQLSEWAGVAANGTGLTWWEYTAGATASILCVHALIAAAGDPRTTRVEAATLDGAYLYISALSTLLDSLIDHDRDVAKGGHSFISYYRDEEEMAERIGGVASRAASEGSRVRHGGHHRMTAAGVASYYLSAPAARRGPCRATRARVVKELRPLIIPVLGIFRLWRLGKGGVARDA